MADTLYSYFVPLFCSSRVFVVYAGRTCLSARSFQALQSMNFLFRRLKLADPLGYFAQKLKSAHAWRYK